MEWAALKPRSIGYNDALSVVSRSAMGEVSPFLRGQPFDPEMFHVMSLAYDKARRHLHDTGQPFVVQEVIAERIIAIAKREYVTPMNSHGVRSKTLVSPQESSGP
jgi:hypothetical protein